jgi:hypothetical protein
MATEPSGAKKGGDSSDANSSNRSEQRLPFEPRTKRKKEKAAKSQPAPAASEKNTKVEKPASVAKATKVEKQTSTSPASMAIPDAVSKRMVRRMALFCGIPSVLGIATFFVSYFLVTQMGIKLPNAAVVLVSMGFFGLGVLGLSYGVLSASWDEDEPGTKFGWQEFKTNFGRMTAAWRSAGQKD